MKGNTKKVSVLRILANETFNSTSVDKKAIKHGKLEARRCTQNMENNLKIT